MHAIMMEASQGFLTLRPRFSRGPTASRGRIRSSTRSAQPSLNCLPRLIEDAGRRDWVRADTHQRRRVGGFDDVLRNDSCRSRDLLPSSRWLMPTAFHRRRSTSYEESRCPRQLIVHRAASNPDTTIRTARLTNVNGTNHIAATNPKSTMRSACIRRPAQRVSNAADNSNNSQVNPRTLIFAS